MDLRQLSAFLLISLCSQGKAKSQILLDPPPVVIPPVVPSRINVKELEQKIERKKQEPVLNPIPGTQTQGTIPPQTQPTEGKSPPPPSHLSQAESLPYRFGMSVQMLAPLIKVKAPREEYKSDPTFQHHTYVRLSSGGSNRINLWGGFRVASFSGTGFFNHIPGRFSFTYYGPSLGIGGFFFTDKTPPPTGRAGSIAEEKLQPQILEHHGWLLLGGFSLVNRKTALDPSNEIPGREFSSSKGATTDGGGAWMEFSYLQIWDEGLTFQYSTGMQLGVGKKIFWIGTGLGGWI